MRQCERSMKGSEKHLTCVGAPCARRSSSVSSRHLPRPQPGPSMSRAWELISACAEKDRNTREAGAAGLFTVCPLDLRKAPHLLERPAVVAKRLERSHGVRGHPARHAQRLVGRCSCRAPSPRFRAQLLHSSPNAAAGGRGLACGTASTKARWAFLSSHSGRGSAASL